MFELTINEQVYPFNFGMGFMREINRKVKQPIDGLANVEKNIGLRYSWQNWFGADGVNSVGSLLL